MRPTLLVIVTTLLVCMSSEVNTFMVKYADFPIYVYTVTLCHQIRP
jgi:hypothetical protein